MSWFKQADGPKPGNSYVPGDSPMTHMQPCANGCGKQVAVYMSTLDDPWCDDCDHKSEMGTEAAATPELTPGPGEQELWKEEYQIDPDVPGICDTCGTAEAPYLCRRCGAPTCGGCGRIPYDKDIDNFLCMGCEEAESGPDVVDSTNLFE